MTSLQTLKLDEPSSPPFLEGSDKPEGLPVVNRNGAASQSKAPPASVCPRPAGPGPNCIGHQAAPLTQDEKIVLLHRHNFYRSQVANGILPGLPQASSMLQMVGGLNFALVLQKGGEYKRVRE